MATSAFAGILLASFILTTHFEYSVAENLNGDSATTRNRDNEATTQATATGDLDEKATTRATTTEALDGGSATTKNRDEKPTTQTTATDNPSIGEDGWWDDEDDDEFFGIASVNNDTDSTPDVSDYALDELIYDYLRSQGGNSSLELAKPVLYDLLEKMLFPSKDSQEQAGSDPTKTETSPVIHKLQEFLQPLVSAFFTPEENGTSGVADITAVFESYSNESFGRTGEPPSVFGISLDSKEPNGKTLIRFAAKFLRTRGITALLTDYLMQVLTLALNKENGTSFNDALLEASIHELSRPSSEVLLKELTVFLLKDIILDSTDLVSCGLNSALDHLLQALAGNVSTSTTGMNFHLAKETMEKLTSLGKDIALHALDLSDMRTIFGRLKDLFSQCGLPLPGDKLVFLALRAVATGGGGIEGLDSLSISNVMEGIMESGLNLDKIAESMVLSLITSKDAPSAFFNIFDTFPLLAREVPALSNLENINLVEAFGDFL